jgi:beta-glucosidase
MKKFYPLFKKTISSLSMVENNSMILTKTTNFSFLSSIKKRTEDLLARMSLEEKIGQMMLVDHTALINNKEDIKNYFIGSVLSGGDSKLTDNSAKSWAEFYDSLQNYAIQTRLKIPILFGTNAVHGYNNVYGATIFPHNIGLGCTRNAKLVEKAAMITAHELAATGIKWNFAPCMAIPKDERWGGTFEGFGETYALAQMMGNATIRGFQKDSLFKSNSILGCAKHYLGEGGTNRGVDRGNTDCDESIIRKIYLSAYSSAIQEGVGSIMVSYGSINGEKITGSKYWITDVLKIELNFSGFVVADWAAVDQLRENFIDCVEIAINAGIDMVMLPFRYKDFFFAVKNLLDERKISISRIDDAVSRIIQKKFELGLFENPFSDKSLLNSVGSKMHRNVARQCVRESLVLLKKKDGILPLKKKNMRILVAGDHADNLGYQCGGWTITWQGGSGNITEGTTILQAIKNSTPQNDICFSENGNFSNTKADYSIVVIGEKPYAEWFGDRKDLNIQNTDVELVRKIKSYGNPVIVILISGRPLILEKIQHYSDVIFAAWLPGSEGEGITDVLFGDYSPSGVLSHSWPQNMNQVPINVGDAYYEPLYEYGFGITSFDDSPKKSPPICLSSAIVDNGKIIELTFNKPLSKSSLTNAQFSVTKNMLSFNTKIRPEIKSNDSTTVLLNLDNRITVDDPDSVIILSYYYGSMSSIDGGLVSPFDHLVYK